ncbi:MAG: glutathione S-transferase family protein [Cyanobacteriota bacterium]|nr:glutathione S-transferase family protein [Cyanobacteriota bacterium]
MISPTLPLTWAALADLAPAEPDRIHGPTNAQSRLRLFDQSREAVRVVLYRDHHAWCPYCHKVWLWLEERRVPYAVRKVSMSCYGDKEPWYRQRVPSGMLPALELDGRLITESDHILDALEASFGPLGLSLQATEVMQVRRQERTLFGAWCDWLCRAPGGTRGDRQAEHRFSDAASALEELIAASPGPLALAGFSVADVVLAPFLERMAASLAYYKGVLLRQRHPRIDRWFRAMEQRAAYLGTQSDFHTHAHDLPPQLGGCVARGDGSQRQLALQIDAGPWPISTGALADAETSQPEPASAAGQALQRVLHHRRVLLSRMQAHQPQQEPALLDRALRCALTALILGAAVPPPAATAASLRQLRDRICVPRDMPLHAARRLRQALEATARLDPLDPQAQGPTLPLQHRRDQDPVLFQPVTGGVPA